MKVVELLERRRENWRELDGLCDALEKRRVRKAGALGVTRFANLYRAACADLALAHAYQLPPGTVEYLHQLVGRAHNQLYRSRGFQAKVWLHELLYVAPARLFRDGAFRLASVLFWGTFLLMGVAAYLSPSFAEAVVSREMLQQIETSYADPIDGTMADAESRSAMSAFYVRNNAGIGLQCFAWGLLLGIGGLYITLWNAAFLGAIFGHMATVPQWRNFYEFVTAHGPFELTAIVLAAAAGMRLGFSAIDTRGYTRGAAMRRAAKEIVPTLSASILLFALAAVIEAFVSPSGLPYAVKAAVAVLSTAVLLFYIVGLGARQGAGHAT